MRLDNYLSDLGVIKRRTIAKEMADGGHIKLNGRRAKPAHQVKENDLIEITGKRKISLRVIAIPTRSVPKDKRTEFYQMIEDSKIDPIDLI